MINIPVLGLLVVLEQCIYCDNDEFLTVQFTHFRNFTTVIILNCILAELLDLQQQQPERFTLHARDHRTLSRREYQSFWWRYGWSSQPNRHFFQYLAGMLTLDRKTPEATFDFNTMGQKLSMKRTPIRCTFQIPDRI